MKKIIQIFNAITKPPTKRWLSTEEFFQSCDKLKELYSGQRISRNEYDVMLTCLNSYLNPRNPATLSRYLSYGRFQADENKLEGFSKNRLFTEMTQSGMKGYAKEVLLTELKNIHWS